jgi:SSS family solute:Na+ symporter
MNYIYITVISAYVILLFFLSALFVKRTLNSYSEYAFCGRQLTLTFIIFTYLGTWIGGGTIIGLTGGAYEHGAGQYWIFALSCLVGFAFAFVFIRRIRGGKYKSIGDLLAARFPGHRQFIRIPVSAALLLRNMTMIGMQFAALAYLLTYAFNIDMNLALLVIFITITAYTSLSGLWAVVSTDIVQGFIQTVGMILLLVISLKLCGGFDHAFSYYNSTGNAGHMNLLSVSKAPADIILYAVCFGTFFLMGDESDWIRIYSAKSTKTSLWGYMIPLTLTLILLLMPTYIGLFDGVLAGSNVSGDYLLYWFIQNKVGNALMLFLLLTVISAVMSTADTYMQACGTIFANIIIHMFVNKNAGDQELIFWSRISTIACGAAGFAFAINVGNLVTLWLSGIAIATVILIPEYLFAWFSKTLNTDGALAGSFTGMAYCLWLLYMQTTTDPAYIITGILLNTAAAFSGTLISRRVRGTSAEPRLGRALFFTV